MTKRNFPTRSDPTMIQPAHGGQILVEESSEAESVLDEELVNRSSTNEDPGTQSSDTSGGIKIAEAESQAVYRSKFVVYLILAVFAIATSAGTWYYVRKEEKNQFEYSFNVHADELLTKVQNNAESIFRQLHTLSTALTSHALDSGLEWPFVSLPHFHIRATELQRLSKSGLIIMAPIVSVQDKDKWEEWSTLNQQDLFLKTFGPEKAATMEPIHAIHIVDEKIVKATKVPLLPNQFLLPALQYGPAASSSGLVNMDLNSHPIIQRSLRDCILAEHSVLSNVTNLTFLLGFTGVERNDYDLSLPRSVIVQPVFDHFEEEKEGARTVVGLTLAVEKWNNYFEGGLPNEVKGFVIDLYDTCGSHMTFTLDEAEVIYRGPEDLHDTKYDYLARRAEFAEFARYDGEEIDDSHCHYDLNVYPSETFEDGFYTSKPYLYAVAVLSVFICTASVFAIYDWMVRRRQTKVLSAAKRNTAIVHSLFPKDVGDRLIANAQEKKARAGRGGKNSSKVATFKADRDHKEGADGDLFDSDPIAEFFTSTTIMFADIVGFTAWSSTREPKQVFQLLETIYHDFDFNAKRRRVFKVETVGDCYVAVAGLPQPRKDHAVVMARFARDCVYRFQTLSQQLEVTLGPDTADLAIRVGLHSGAVTAGVLRGERARFQLFGDAMNTASRMESTSAPNKIHISQETADLLAEAEKGHWCRKREDTVEAKGKGKMQTYWLEVRVEGPKSSTSGHSTVKEVDPTSSEGADPSRITAKTEPKQVVIDEELNKKEARLVKWNIEILTKFLIQMAERRHLAETKPDPQDKIYRLEQSLLRRSGGMVLNEVKDIIRFPSVNTYSAKRDKGDLEIQLSKAVTDQLQDLVRAIAGLYRDNPFHNFEHASHVTMSVVKLLSRIVAPNIQSDEVNREQTLHDHTYGITSDPMTSFSCALSALIHDADHLGVPNSTLVAEQTPASVAYGNKSVAEQNSVDICWSLLMQDDYADLRRAIYVTEDEFWRFRSLVVNSVMATDIMDRDLGTERKNRWNKAFAEGALENEDQTDHVNRKATIVLEHLIQASDVAHTMQHWQVYLKWNKRLFEELFKAYKEGHSAKDPAEFWYTGEIGFFDYYLIPLAKKLRNCGVFGVSSDEYLNYATRNRKEWEIRGQAIVEEFREAALAQYAAVGQITAENLTDSASSAVSEKEESKPHNDEPGQRVLL